MWHFNYYINLLLIMLLASGCSANTQPPLKAESYIITYEEDAPGERWGEYLFSHLSKRTEDKSIVILKKGGRLDDVPQGAKNIHFEVATDLENDYCIEHTINRLHIRVRNNETALWIVYQLINNVAEEDNRFSAEDLPPAIINFDSKCKNFDFIYREPHFAPNLRHEHSPIIGANNLETDWGLWGHNLSKIIKGNQSDNIYALVNGKRNKSQFSFSSPELFEFMSNYIAENYGVGDQKTYRFMIMPEDDDLVCTCPACAQLGNTPDNATPAVTNLIHKLAERFPKHQFFTTAYRTTAKSPSDKLPDNAGVFFSTINLPKGIEPDMQKASTKQFIDQLNTWKEKTPNIYLWDYAANFDDYLTPIPVLFGLQKQFQFFKELGVKGIFLNASGYDYSSFNDVKTFVCEALMMDVNVDVNNLCRKFFKRKYPESHKLLSDYYLQLEHAFYSKKKAYNMYGSMKENMNTYFNTDEFIEFYDTLKDVIPNTEDLEKRKLEKLYTALSYTRLQIAYVKGYDDLGFAKKEGDKITVKPEIDTFVQTLEGAPQFSNLTNYKETDGALSDYITEWKQVIAKGSYTNALMDVSVKLLSRPDEGFEKTDLLNNGTPGFAMDYHQGWYLSSTDDMHISFSAEKLQQAQTIQLRFLSNERHGIYPPEKILVSIDGQIVKEIHSDQIMEFGNIAECTMDINLAGTKNVDLKFIRRQAPKSIIACDEITVLN